MTVEPLELAGFRQRSSDPNLPVYVGSAPLNCLSTVVIPEFVGADMQLYEALALAKSRASALADIPRSEAFSASSLLDQTILLLPRDERAQLAEGTLYPDVEEALVRPSSVVGTMGFADKAYIMHHKTQRDPEFFFRTLQRNVHGLNANWTFATHSPEGQVQDVEDSTLFSTLGRPLFEGMQGELMASLVGYVLNDLYSRGVEVLPQMTTERYATLVAQFTYGFSSQNSEYDSIQAEESALGELLNSMSTSGMAGQGIGALLAGDLPDGIGSLGEDIFVIEAPTSETPANERFAGLREILRKLDPR